MPFAVSSIIPFPNISWWAAISACNAIYLDETEHFRKMSFQNRYYITGANGIIQLSIPLSGGRDQHAAMRDLKIHNDTRWQMQHWRTIVSVYKRSPYFDFYETTLHELFERPYSRLVDFNIDTIHWLKNQLKVSFEEIFPTTYKKEYENTEYDIRDIKANAAAATSFPQYYQLFSERNGFLPNLSVLDLLFSEGPYAMQWIKEKKENILSEN